MVALTAMTAAAITAAVAASLTVNRTTASATVRPEADSYIGYSIGLSGSSFEPATVRLTDQFGSRNYTIAKPSRLLGPAEVSGAGILAPELNYLAHPVALAEGEAPLPRVTGLLVTNSFGAYVVAASKPRVLLAPAAVEVGSSPAPLSAQANHYLCYGATASAVYHGPPMGSVGGSPFLGVLDFMQRPWVIETGDTKWLCNPAVNSHDGAVSSIADFDTHLFCFDATLAAGQDPYEPVRRIKSVSQFGEESFRTTAVREFCAPSYKFHPFDGLGATQAPPGLVSWWPADGDAADATGSNDGALRNGATFAPGTKRQGFFFDGTDDFVEVPDSPDLNITGDVTVDFWARRTAFGTSQTLVQKGGGSHGGADAPTVYMVYFAPGIEQLQATFEQADGTNHFVSGPVVTDGEMHHYAYVRSGNTHMLYFDGEVAGESAFPAGPADTSGLPLSIGARYHQPAPGEFDWHFAGIIDELEVFNRALSPEEVMATFEAGRAGRAHPVAPPPAPPDSTATVAYAMSNVPAVSGVPHTGGGVGATRLIGGVEEHLFADGADGSMTPELIESWSINPTGSTFTAALKQGIPWGSPVGYEHVDFGDVTASDVVAWFNLVNAATNPGSADGDAGDFAAVFGPAHVTGAYTFEVDLVMPVFFCLPVSQSGCLGSQRGLENVTTIDTMGLNWARAHHVGSGPFIQGDCVGGSHCTLNAVSGHWRKTPEISRLTAVQAPDENTRMALLRSGIVDFADIDYTRATEIVGGGIRFLQTMDTSYIGQSVIWSGNLWEEFHARNGAPLAPWASPAYAVDYPWIGNPWGHAGQACTLTPTCGNAPYADTNNPAGMEDMEQARLVRLALGTAMDRDAMNATLLGGTGLPLYSEYMGPAYPGWDSSRVAGVYDVWGNAAAASGTAQPVPWQLPDGNQPVASALLDAAGYPRGPDGLRTGFTSLVLQKYVAEAGESAPRFADALGAVWAELGIPVTVEWVNYGGVVSPRMGRREEHNPTLKNGDVHSSYYPLDWPMPAADTSATRPGWGTALESPAGANWLAQVMANPDAAAREQLHLGWVDYSVFWQQYSGVYQVPKGVFAGPRVRSWNGRQQQYSNRSTSPELIVLE
jgi:ABC-type transport system substrate-binding protein